MGLRLLHVLTFFSSITPIYVPAIPEAVAEKSYLKQLIEAEEAALTSRESYLRSMGFTEADERASAKSIGLIEVALLGILGLLIFIADFPDYRREYKRRFKPNLCGITADDKEIKMSVEVHESKAGPSWNIS